MDALLQKVEELSARMSALEAENARLKQENRQLKEENAQVKKENQLLRQRLDQFIRHYFGGRHNEGLDRRQLELLLQGLPNVVEMPVPEAKPSAAPRAGQSHPARRVLAEDRLETEEIVIEPEEVKAQPEGWKQISLTSRRNERKHRFHWGFAKKCSK
jgi:regulator of replication initiation timing